MIKFELVRKGIVFSTVKTKIAPDDPLYSLRNDDRNPFQQYEEGEEYIYFDFSNWDTDFVCEPDDKHVIYTREAYEYCILGFGNIVSREKPVVNMVHANLWEKMRSQAEERSSALKAGVDFDHLPGMPWIGAIEETE